MPNIIPMPTPQIGQPFVPPNLQSISQEVADITQLHGSLRDNIAAGIQVELDQAGTVVPALGDVYADYIGQTLAECGRVADALRALFTAHVDGTLNATSQLWADIENIIRPEHEPLQPVPPIGRVGRPVSSAPPAVAPAPTSGGVGPVGLPITNPRPGGPTPTPTTGTLSGSSAAVPCVQPPPTQDVLRFLSARDAAGRLDWPLTDWPLEIFTPNCHNGFWYSFEPTPRSRWEIPLGVIGGSVQEVPFSLYFNLQTNVSSMDMVALPGLDGFPITDAVPIDPNEIYQAFVASVGLQATEACLAATLCGGIIPRPVGRDGSTLPSSGGGGTDPITGVVFDPVVLTPCDQVKGRSTDETTPYWFLLGTANRGPGNCPYQVALIPPAVPVASVRNDAFGLVVFWGPFKSNQLAYDWAWANYVPICCGTNPPPVVILPTSGGGTILPPVPPITLPSAGGGGGTICPPAMPPVTVNVPPCPPPTVNFTCPKCGHESAAGGDDFMADWEWLLSSDSEKTMDELGAFLGSEAVRFLDGSSVIESMARVATFNGEDEDLA